MQCSVENCRNKAIIEDVIAINDVEIYTMHLCAEHHTNFKVAEDVNGIIRWFGGKAKVPIPKLELRPKRLLLE